MFLKEFHAMCFQKDTWKERLIELELPCGKRKAFLTFFSGTKLPPHLVGHKHGQPGAHLKQKQYWMEEWHALLDYIVFSLLFSSLIPLESIGDLITHLFSNWFLCKWVQQTTINVQRVDWYIFCIPWGCILWMESSAPKIF